MGGGAGQWELWGLCMVMQATHGDLGLRWVHGLSSNGIKLFFLQILGGCFEFTHEGSLCLSSCTAAAACPGQIWCVSGTTTSVALAELSVRTTAELQLPESSVLAGLEMVPAGHGKEEEQVPAVSMGSSWTSTLVTHLVCSGTEMV